MSQLAELERVSAWTEALAKAGFIPRQLQFAVDLCLEEALSNVIRHGYGGREDGVLSVEFRSGVEGVSFVIEDSAPPFNPLRDAALAAMPLPTALADVVPGGHGIRLMRSFANAIDYEQMADGNRLVLRFLSSPVQGC